MGPFPALRTDSLANKLTIHFDKPWMVNRSSLRLKTADEVSYDPSHSWDARSDDPRAFTRLQATEMPVQTAHPVTMSNGAVCELETRTDGLRVLGVKQSDKALKPIPLTVEQKDVDMQINDMSATSSLEERQSPTVRAPAR